MTNRIQHFIRLCVAISMLYGFWFVFKMDQYLPWQVRVLNGIKLTLIGHLGPWLATIEIKSMFRFVIAAILLPSMVGIFFLWWTVELTAAFIALGVMTLLMFHTMEGEKFEHRSIYKS